MVRRIVACGGQQLLFPALTTYLFGLARRPRPRVLFLGTASGDGPGYLLTFYQALAGVDCEPSHLALFARRRPKSSFKHQTILRPEPDLRCFGYHPNC